MARKLIGLGINLNNEGDSALITSKVEGKLFRSIGDDFQLTPLGIAYYYMAWEIVDILHQNGSRDVMALHYAARDGRIEDLAKFIQAGYDINFQDHRGQTPLDIAYGYEARSSIIEMLIKAGAKTKEVQ